MEAKKTKRTKSGGRRKGTPNKITGAVREILSRNTVEYFSSEEFRKDMADLDPKDRIWANIKVAEFTIPKPQTISLDVAEGTKVTIEDRLRELSGEDDG